MDRREAEKGGRVDTIFDFFLGGREDDFDVIEGVFWERIQFLLDVGPVEGLLTEEGEGELGVFREEFFESID